MLNCVNLYDDGLLKVYTIKVSEVEKLNELPYYGLEPFD